MSGVLPTAITSHCRICGHNSTIFLVTSQDRAGFEMWLRGSTLRDSFGHWDDDKIDTLVTGVHPDCYDPNADVKEHTNAPVR